MYESNLINTPMLENEDSNSINHKANNEVNPFDCNDNQNINQIELTKTVAESEASFHSNGLIFNSNHVDDLKYHNADSIKCERQFSTASNGFPLNDSKMQFCPDAVSENCSESKKCESSKNPSSRNEFLSGAMNHIDSSLTDLSATSLTLKKEESYIPHKKESGELSEIDNSVISASDNSGSSPSVKERKHEKSKIKPKEEKSAKRKLANCTEDDGDAKGKKQKNQNLRRNIRDIMEDENVDSETRAAQLKEYERIKRVQEAQQRALIEQQKKEESQIRELIEMSNEISDSAKPSSEEKDDIICLDSGEENEASAHDNDIIETHSQLSASHLLKKSCSDVIDVSSEEENSDLISSEGFGLLNSTSTSSIKDDEDEEEESEDPENSGSHTNDNLNRPDEFGRVLVNVGHSEDEEDIFIAPQLSPIIKPHQIGGIRFLYENIIESVNNFDKNSGFGCILAHSMGLGKTLQIITFCDVFLRHTSARLVIIVAPINTIQNWVSEFEMWIPPFEKLNGRSDVRPRTFKVFTLLDNIHKHVGARHELIKSWNLQGGVLLMGYEMYRLLTIKNLRKLQGKRGKKRVDEIVDIEEEDRNKELLADIYTYLCDPGPDLVVCDEGHRIKNNQAGVSQALKNIKTRRRIVLTGYPLQNNLLEYWCMVDFSRPNYLGSKAEFSNMFERPIMNGQCVDSTTNDRRLMKFRSHVLHSLLLGFVQRRSHSVLRYSLPAKEEHVLMIRLTPLQRSLYTLFMEELKSRKSISNPLKAFAVCIKICNHLDILYRVMSDKKLNENDLDLDENGVASGSRKKKASSRSAPKISNEINLVQGIPHEVTANPYSSKEKETLGYDWANEFMLNYRPGLIQNGCKMVVLFAIIKYSLQNGERLLIFSQSLYTLDLIEEFLQRSEIPERPNTNDIPGERWIRNRSYFRLDGSTSAQERERLINAFNKNEKIGLFILSTRAGCLGINLIGANRVVIYDASWNPCHDAQAICRVYRYGQRKPIHVYRLVTDNSLEKKIYERQVRKRGMSDRVVDELSPEAKFTTVEMSTLLNTTDEEPAPLDLSEHATSFSDVALKNLCTFYCNQISQKPFEHESLLLSRSEEKLTKYEKKLAKQSYEFEKRYSTFNKSAYTTVYNTQGSALTGTPAKIYNNVRYTQPMSILNQQAPIQSTPLPMRPFHSNPSFIGVGGATEFSKQGVTVQKITINKELSITASKPGVPPIVIPSGKQVLVLKTMKGVYLRTPEGKVIAVKLPQNKTGNPGAQPTPNAQGASKEVIDISDDEDHAATSNLTGGSEKKSMYNVNSMMHTSGGGILQNKTHCNMPPNSSTITNPVILNQHATSSSVCLDLNPISTNMNSIDENNRSADQHSSRMASSSELDDTHIPSAMNALNSLRDVPCIPLNNVSVSRSFESYGNQGNMINSQCDVAGTKVSSNATSEDQTSNLKFSNSESTGLHNNAMNINYVNPLMNSTCNNFSRTEGEHSAFSDLHNFVNKTSLLMGGANSLTNGLNNAKSSGFGTLLPNELNPSINSSFGVSNKFPHTLQLQANQMNPSFDQNTHVSNNASPRSNLSASGNEIKTTMRDSKNHYKNIKTSSSATSHAVGNCGSSNEDYSANLMPNLLDAGLNVESLMPSNNTTNTPNQAHQSSKNNVRYNNSNIDQIIASIGNSSSNDSMDKFNQLQYGSGETSVNSFEQNQFNPSAYANVGRNQNKFVANVNEINSSQNSTKVDKFPINPVVYQSSNLQLNVNEKSAKVSDGSASNVALQRFEEKSDERQNNVGGSEEYSLPSFFARKEKFSPPHVPNSCYSQGLVTSTVSSTSASWNTLPFSSLGSMSYGNQNVMPAHPVAVHPQKSFLNSYATTTSGQNSFDYMTQQASGSNDGSYPFMSSTSAQYAHKKQSEQMNVSNPYNAFPSGPQSTNNYFNVDTPSNPYNHFDQTFDQSSSGQLPHSSYYPSHFPLPNQAAGSSLYDSFPSHTDPVSSKISTSTSYNIQPS